jgi:hypothetical protein
MIRQIIIPTSNTYTLQLQIPNSMIGKKIAVIYDEEEDVLVEEQKPTPTKIKASEIFKDCKVSLKDYKFNRDEANDYE